MQDLLDDLVADDPVLGTVLGMTEGAGRLPSWSAAALERRRELLHVHERRLTPLLAAEDTGAAVDAFAALQVVRRRLRLLELRRAPQRHPGAVLEVAAAVFPLLVRELGTTGERVEALASRLAAVPRLLAEGTEALEPGLSAAAVESGIDFAEGLLDLAGPTARAFAASVGREGAVDEASAAAVVALAAFRDFLRDELAPTATDECAAGEGVLADILLWEHALDEPPGGPRGVRPRGAGRDQGGDGGDRGGGGLRRRRRGRRRRPGGHADRRRARRRLPARRRRGARLRRGARHRRPAAGRGARGRRHAALPALPCSRSPPTTRRARSRSASSASTT